jgi:uroporphyrinogen-III synthase
MAERLNGYRILILETREEAQFSRLLTERGADVLQCPMFTIHDAPDPAPIEAWIRRFIEKPCDDLVLMTGEGLRRLMKVARRLDLEQKLRGRRWRTPGSRAKGFCACQALRRRGVGMCLAISTPAVLPSVGRKTSAPRTCLTPLNT